ncbi:MAG: diacylglycerol kinase family lipid kinase [Proteobacteria bacterium]|nr:diacylglycerol kinase family lipid kinase [Pseudomonadota bacterium]MBU1716754.1 diacylglycerol kinase family lipid kinase [Pseudomonadota bacterium]
MTKINSSTLIIINPKAGNGAAGRKRNEIETLANKFFCEHQTLLTNRPGQAADYARRAIEAGVRKLICVGGDGTLNEVVNGLLSVKVEKNRRPKLGYLPLGTGSDLARTTEITGNIEKGLRNIANNEGKWIDVGNATFVDHDGKKTSRYFINVLSFALGGEIAGRVNRSSKVMGGFLSFLWPTLTALFSFNKPLISIKIDNKADQKIICWHAAIANGQYHGGGMRIAPDAKVDDGRLRITVVGDLSLPEVLLNLPNLYNGNIYAIKKVYKFSGKKIVAESEDNVLLDLDGEQVGRLPVSVEILPLALWMIY